MNFASLCGTSDVVRDDPTNNVSDVIFEKIGRGLHLRPEHPLGIIRSEIHKYFDSLADAEFLKFDDLLPVVATVNVSANRFEVCGGHRLWESHEHTEQ